MTKIRILSQFHEVEVKGLKFQVQDQKMSTIVCQRSVKVKNELKILQIDTARRINNN